MSAINIWRVIIVALLAFWGVVFWATDAHSCEFKFCKSRIEMPKTHVLRNLHHQKTGDIYDPGHGRRLQIRNNHRQILGYIERSGSITNIHRQKIGEVK